MYRLSFLVLLVALMCNANAQEKKSHGSDFKMDCKACHNPGGWKVETNKIAFKHETTNFKLQDQHATADCKKCHQTLVFSEAKSECVTCHKDVHSMSVGNDCVRCHTSKNWLVNNVQQLHEQNGFQMAGAHTVLSCIDCHKSETNQRWDRIGNDCASCHQKNFNTTTSPNHKLSGFSTNCSDCHEPISTTWGGGNFHYFFSLTQGHDTRDCAKCHEGNNYKTAKPDCISCHTKDYNNATNPKHSGPPFGTNCASCHTTNKGWKPVTVNFHTKFPLTESHNINECAKCHDPNNYGAAKPECASCHMNDYNATSNPKHTQPAFGTNCAECHSTKPGWKPVSTNFHTKFQLTLGHSITDCSKCHDPNDYSKASSDCASCHTTTYNNTTNPKHATSGFGTNCALCHTTNKGWKPAQMTNHDGTFFPIYSGEHRGKWSSCVECHLNLNNYAQFSCINCHEHSNSGSVANDHKGVANYSFNSNSCLNCHPKGK